MSDIRKPIQARHIDLPSSDFRNSMYHALLRSYKAFGNNIPPEMLNRFRQEVDYVLITFILDIAEGNIALASRLLGCREKVINILIKRYNINPNDYKVAYGDDRYDIRKNP